MIIRCFRYRVRPGCRDEFEALSRTDGARRARDLDGVRLALAGRSVDDPDAGVVLSAWEDFAAVDALVHADLAQPTFVPPAVEAMLASHEVTHWEALDLEDVGAGEAAVLRIMTGEVDATRDAAYFAYVRETVWPRLADTDGLSGAWVGRQVNGGTVEHVLAVSTWRTGEAIRAAGAGAGPMFDDHAEAGLRLGAVELFELFASVVRPRADAG